MNISKSIGIVTAAIPVVGILIGGITFGVNFKTDVDLIKEDIAQQQTMNIDITDRLNSLPDAYDDSLIWLSIDNIDIPEIPEGYDDSYISERIQLLEIDLAELTVLLDGVDVGEEFDDSDLRGRIAELEGSLQAMGNIEVDGNGEVDLGPLIVSIATLEGSMQTVRTDIRNMKTDIKNNERAASSAASSSGSSRTVENRYDDSNLRTRISAVERQVNSLPSSSSSGGTTIQRVENPFDDSALRADISRLQTAIAVLQAAPDNAYDDSNLRDMIDDIQWELENLDIPNTPDTVDTSWLEDLMYDIKNELSMRIDELEWASDTTTTSDDMYAEKWLLEDLQYEVMYIQEQVWELQTLVNESQSSSNNNTTTSDNVEGGANANPHLYINHNQDSYTGDYWSNGEYNGHPLWINWECGNPGSQFEYCYIYRHPVGFTNSGWVWVIQPIPPSDEWSANAYTDGRWPWKKAWSGDVNSVEVIGE